jgi:tRNA threonylcarbamoyladenosine biosynthesis protein TsaB
VKILSVDAAGKSLSVAVVEDGRVLAFGGLNVGLTHSQRLLPLLQNMLDGAALELSALDMIAVTNGPGSFTGLRIGLATAKGLAETLQIPLLPVCTLDAQAYNARGMGSFICPVLDARRNEVYTAIYGAAGDQIVPPMAVAPAELARRLQGILQDAEESDNAENSVIFVGDAAELIFAGMQAALGDKARIVPAERRFFGACGCAMIAAEQPERALPPAQVEAFYLRISEAERNRLAKLAANKDKQAEKETAKSSEKEAAKP